MTMATSDLIVTVGSAGVPIMGGLLAVVRFLWRILRSIEETATIARGVATRYDAHERTSDQIHTRHERHLVRLEARIDRGRR